MVTLFTNRPTSGTFKNSRCRSITLVGVAPSDAGLVPGDVGPFDCCASCEARAQAWAHVELLRKFQTCLEHVDFYCGQPFCGRPFTMRSAFL